MGTLYRTNAIILYYGQYSLKLYEGSIVWTWELPQPDPYSVSNIGNWPILGLEAQEHRILIRTIHIIPL